MGGNRLRIVPSHMAWSYAEHAKLVIHALLALHGSKLAIFSKVTWSQSQSGIGGFRRIGARGRVVGGAASITGITRVAGGTQRVTRVVGVVVG